MYSFTLLYIIFKIKTACYRKRAVSPICIYDGYMYIYKLNKVNLSFRILDRRHLKSANAYVGNDHYKMFMFRVWPFLKTSGCNSQTMLWYDVYEIITWNSWFFVTLAIAGNYTMQSLWSRRYDGDGSQQWKYELGSVAECGYYPFDKLIFS